MRVWLGVRPPFRLPGLWPVCVPASPQSPRVPPFPPQCLPRWVSRLLRATLSVLHTELALARWLLSHVPRVEHGPQTRCGESRGEGGEHRKPLPVTRNIAGLSLHREPGLLSMPTRKPTYKRGPGGAAPRAGVKGRTAGRGEHVEGQGGPHSGGAGGFPCPVQLPA